MIDALEKKYIPLVAKMIFNGLTSRNLSDHALNFRSRYSSRGDRCRRDHECAKDIIRSVVRNPQRCKISVLGYEMKANGYVRYVAYAYDPNLSSLGAAKVITADAPFPPTKYLQPQILTTYREFIGAQQKQRLEEMMPISYIMEGKTEAEYRAHKEDLRNAMMNAQVSARKSQDAMAKLQEIMPKRGNVTKAITEMFTMSGGNYEEIPYDRMKEALIARSALNGTIGNLIKIIKESKPNFGEPAVEVSPIPSEEYDSLVKEFIDIGVKKHDRLYAEYMPPEAVDEVKTRYRELNDKLAATIPENENTINCFESNYGRQPMSSKQVKFNAFLESVCNQFGCRDALRPLQQGFSALCEAFDYHTGELPRAERNCYTFVQGNCTIKDMPISEITKDVVDKKNIHLDRDDYSYYRCMSAAEATKAMREQKACCPSDKGWVVIYSSPKEFIAAKDTKNNGVFVYQAKLLVTQAGESLDNDPEWNMNPADRKANRKARWDRTTNGVSFNRPKIPQEIVEKVEKLADHMGWKVSFGEDYSRNRWGETTNRIGDCFTFTRVLASNETGPDNVDSKMIDAVMTSLGCRLVDRDVDGPDGIDQTVYEYTTYMYEDSEAEVDPDADDFYYKRRENPDDPELQDYNEYSDRMMENRSNSWDSDF